MRGTIGLSPLAVFIAVLAGGQFAGPLGALLALPIAATIQVVIFEVLRSREKDLALEQAALAFGPVPPWRSVLTQFLGHDASQQRDGDEPRGRAKEQPSDGSQVDRDDD